MRFYLASSFELRDTVQDVCDHIEREGHSVPVKWWGRTSEAHEAMALPGTDDEFYSKPFVLLTAARELGGVATCEQFVLIAGENRKRFNGAFVELGYALALGKPCFVLGRLERSAMFAHVRRVGRIEELFPHPGLSHYHLPGLAPGMVP